MKSIEKTLNKIYEEREEVDLPNLESTIKTMADSMIYGLKFIKEEIILYKKYLLEWSNWIDNDINTQKTTLKDEYKNNCCEVELALLCELELKDGTCENVVNSTIQIIELCIDNLNNNNYEQFDFNFNCLNINLEKLNILEKIYISGFWYQNINNSFSMCCDSKYQFVSNLNVPIVTGLENIFNTSQALKILYDYSNKTNLEFELFEGSGDNNAKR